MPIPAPTPLHQHTGNSSANTAQRFRLSGSHFAGAKQPAAMETDHLNCRFPLVFAATVQFPRQPLYKKFSKIPEIFKTPLVTF